MAQWTPVISSHFGSVDLDRLVKGELAGGERRRLAEHLAHRCSECWSAVAQYGGITAVAAAPADYDGAIARAFSTAQRVALPRQQAIATLASLLLGDRSWQDLSASDILTLRGLPQMQALIEAGRALRHKDPQAMLHFAKLARYCADRLRARDFGRQPVADLRALAWAELSSAYRVSNELRAAETAMRRAVYWCQRGSGSELLFARIAGLLASLLAYQRRFDEGQKLMALVYRTHMAAGRQHLAGRALITQGCLAAWAGSARPALLLMRRGLDFVDQEHDPQLVVQTIWNMVDLLADMGHFRRARRLLWRSRSLYAGVVEPHRLQWLDGKIFAGLSEFARAEAAFKSARAGFAERGQVYPAALVGLDLAALWTRQHRTNEVYELAEEIIAAFQTLRIAREAIAALIVMQQACMQGGNVLGLIEVTVNLLRRLDRQPAKQPRLP
jgi:hypothetical protein